MQIESYRYAKVYLYNKLQSKLSIYCWGKLKEQKDVDLSGQTTAYVYELYKQKASKKPDHIFLVNEDGDIVKDTESKSKLKIESLVMDDPQNIEITQEDWMETSDDIMTVGSNNKDVVAKRKGKKRNYWEKAVVVNEPRKHPWDEFVEKSNLNLDGTEYNVS